MVKILQVADYFIQNYLVYPIKVRKENCLCTDCCHGQVTSRSEACKQAQN